jgi:hypothetical protein
MGLPCKYPGKDKRKPLVTFSNLLRVINLNSLNDKGWSKA